MSLAATDIKDEKIRAAYISATQSSSRSGATITLSEVRKIFNVALDKENSGFKVSASEKDDLVKILTEVLHQDAKMSPTMKNEIRVKLSKLDEKVNYKRLSKRESKKYVEVLKGGYIRGIDFGINNRHYAPSFYPRVARLIEHGNIELWGYYAASNEEVFTDSPLGLYQSGKNVLSVQLNRQKLGYSTLVHEATHAIQDMWDMKADVYEVESAAHIAQGIFLRAIGEPLYDRLTKMQTVIDMIRNGSKKSFQATRQDSDYQTVVNALTGVYRKKDVDFSKDTGSQLEQLSWVLSSYA